MDICRPSSDVESCASADRADASVRGGSRCASGRILRSHRSTRRLVSAVPSLLNFVPSAPAPCVASLTDKHSKE